MAIFRRERAAGAPGMRPLRDTRFAPKQMGDVPPSPVFTALLGSWAPPSSAAGGGVASEKLGQTHGGETDTTSLRMTQKYVTESV